MYHEMYATFYFLFKHAIINSFSPTPDVGSLRIWHCLFVFIALMFPPHCYVGIRTYLVNFKP